MSENVAKIRQAVDRVDPNNTSEWMRRCRADAHCALDALLAEHRAEVEALHVEVRQGQDEALRSACRADAARDAALEEAKARALEVAALWTKSAAGTRDEAVRRRHESRAGALQDLAISLDVLKSQPARQTCMCVNTCVSPEELRAGWKCALGRERS